MFNPTAEPPSKWGNRGDPLMMLEGVVPREHPESTCTLNRLFHNVARKHKSPPVGLEPTIFGLEVRRLVH